MTFTVKSAILSLLLCLLLPLSGEEWALPPGGNRPIEGEGGRVFFPFPLTLDESRIVLTYRSETSCRLILYGQRGEERKMNLPPSRGESHLLDAILSFPLSHLVLTDAGGKTVPLSLSLSLISAESYDAPYLRANQRRILERSDLDESPYALYLWSRDEGILIFDFADYRIQDRYLKRLAFFMEKPGYRGTLMTDEEMEGLHGWNAHDYSAWGLADFFNLAREEDFPLNPEERELEKILLDRGILFYNGTDYEEGIGAIVSLSRETSDRLRRRFFTHEVLHGLFFTHPEFREEIRLYWESLPSPYRQAWLFFMEHNFYDPRDEMLMYNELLGYTLQLERDQVGEYYLWKFGRIGQLHPEEGEYLQTLYPHLTRVMEEIYDGLEEIAGRHFSYRNGYLPEN